MRSPNYPAYGLAETIEMAKAIWKEEARTTVSPDVAVKALRHRSLNGTARRKLSSLKAFGLLEELKNGGVRISDLAMRLLHQAADSAEYREAIREAALKPGLYEELYGSHGKASDNAIQSFLMVKKAFSEVGARRFVEVFRGTLKLANVGGEAYTTAVDENKPEKKPLVGDMIQWHSLGVPQLPAPRRVRALSKDGEWAFVDGRNEGLPIKELTIVTPVSEDPKRTHDPPVTPPTLPENQACREDVFSLSEGPVTLTWPAVLSKDSFEDLSAWLDIVKRKIGRSIKTGNEGARSTGGPFSRAGKG
jgi:hypothetical protein